MGRKMLFVFLAPSHTPTCFPPPSFAVYSTPSLDDPEVLAGLAQIVQDNACDIVNMSFGRSEYDASYAYLADPYEALYRAGNAQGITFVASSGDYGSNDCVTQTQGGTTFTFPCADNPASSPQVTGVGGTSLVAGSSANTGLSGTSNAGYVSENAWPRYLLPDEFGAYTGNPPTAGGAWGSGGGESVWFPHKPGYQNLVATGYSSRTTPDVAGMMGTLAAPYQCSDASCISAYYLVNGGTIALVLGTSGSSPTFTGERRERTFFFFFFPVSQPLTFPTHPPF